MKLLCVARFVPDGDWIEPVGDGQITVRPDCRMVLAPQDAAAIGFALKMKEQVSDLVIEVLTMATPTLTPLIEDIVRVGVDRATLLAHSQTVSCDTVTQAQILGGYLKTAKYDWILAGSDAVGAEAAPLVPALAETLGLDQVSNILCVNEALFERHDAELDVREGCSVTTCAVTGPAILSFDRRCGYPMPYVRMKDRKRDVSDRLVCLKIEDLQFDPAASGPDGFRTKLIELTKREKRSVSPDVVGLDDEGIDRVYRFLKENRLV